LTDSSEPETELNPATDRCGEDTPFGARLNRALNDLGGFRRAHGACSHQKQCDGHRPTPEETRLHGILLIDRMRIAVREMTASCPYTSNPESMAGKFGMRALEGDDWNNQ
jgi:hypothetical protein